LIQKGKDLEVTKSHYSAFGSTSLLLTLRSKLITDLYLCGCITNLSVYATAMDAARYGIRITLIDDCLGYRRRDRHDAAIKQLRDFMEAEAMDKNTVLERLRNPPEGSEYDYSEASEVSSEDFQHVNMTEPKPVEMKAQEADVDDSEGEVHSPIPSLVNGRRLALRYLSKTSGSPKPLADGRPRVPSFEPSKSTGSRHLSHHSHNITGSWNGQGIETCAPERKSVTSPVELKKRESSRHAIRPCLDTGSRTAPDSQPTSKPTAKMSALTDHPGKIFTYSSVDELSHPTIVEVDGTHQATPAEGEAVTSVNPATRSRPLFGDKNEDESAGSRILFQLLPKPVAKRVFEELRTEVNWQKMYHQNGEVPRLVCCQGTVSTDGSMPVYRHPSDQSVPLQPWTTNVDLVRKAAEDVVGHELNHVLIQLYRGGSDFISEHSDKTLDVVPGSNIVNVSFGAQRTMRLRTKRRVLEGAGEPPPRTAHRVPLPHNSMITMSLATNAEYLHGINADKRQERELAQAEKAYDGERISLTFRQIATFINQNSSLIWGQGASGKTVETARPVINGDPVESEKLVNAFGTENRASSIAWKDAYGEGSDVLHLKNVK
jgi:alkylated DNA repair dioxygenase AlkB